MKRYQGNRKTYGPKPVEKIEVSESHVKLRVVLLIVFIVLAIVAFGYGVISYLSVDAGWALVESSVVGGNEFTCYYYAEKGGLAGSAEVRSMTALYNGSIDRAYILFDASMESEGKNVKYLNDHPNETVEIDPVLYRAFEEMYRADTRYLYYAPIYDLYQSMSLSSSTAEAFEYDPIRNENVKAYVNEVLPYLKNDVNVQLLGGNQVKLRVSDEYLAFAKENGIEKFIDFYWLKNAFVLDSIVDTFKEAGVQNVIVSSNGFSRAIGTKGEKTQNLYERVDDKIVMVCGMPYYEAYATVSFRNVPVESGDRLFYSRSENGYYTPFIDENGVSQGKDCMLLYAEQKSCSAVALNGLDVILGGKDVKSLSGIDAIVYGNQLVSYTGSPELKWLYEGYQTQKL